MCYSEYIQNDHDRFKFKFGFICTLLASLALTLLFALTAGGLQIKGLQGASMSRCSFSPADTPYQYPDQPLAGDDPPYSTLFEEVCIGGGTERPVSGLVSTTDRNDTYVCACCGAKLFGGESKFDSGTGWPSFWAPYDSTTIGYARDLVNVEVHCSNCKAHLGHVFTWPQSTENPGVSGLRYNPTGLRYCIDGVCLRKVLRGPDEIGGAWMDNPMILPDMLVLFLCVALLGSCCGCCCFGGSLASERRQAKRPVRAVREEA